jgi:hypothetical protein
MKRLIAACTLCMGMAQIAAAQPLARSTTASGWNTPVPSVAAPARSSLDTVPPPPVTSPSNEPQAPNYGSPGESYLSREARAHEQYLMQSQANAEWIHRAAIARADQRNRRLESQRWFGISNTRPNASPDPFDGDYAPGWASNYPFYPMRWLGGGEPWGLVEGQ